MFWLSRRLDSKLPHTVFIVLFAMLLLTGCACGGGASNDSAFGLCQLARQF